MSRPHHARYQDTRAVHIHASHAFPSASTLTSKPVTAEATSPAAEDSDENGTVELHDEDGEDYEGMSEGEDDGQGEGEVSESGVDEYELRARGRRPVTAADYAAAYAAAATAAAATTTETDHDEDEDDEEGTINGDQDMDEGEGEEEEEDGEGEGEEDEDEEDEEDEEEEEEEEEEQQQEDGAHSAYSDSTGEESDDPEKVDPCVAEEMERFEATFRGFSKRFRLINKIGEGTFSSVYKAEDLLYDNYDNSWDIDYRRPSSPEPGVAPSPLRRQRRGGGGNGAGHPPRRPKFVAVKKIYVTSSPARIQNELALLHDLTGHPSVVPLITAFRHADQVVAVLPYFKHVDFREYFRALTIPDIRLYFRSLFAALAHVHNHGIIHRDIKPTNFLYDFRYGRGVLVDFGLAEREGTETQWCVCQHSPTERREARPPAMPQSVGYLKHDSRPGRRANRAGTRGFRAPEVLFKCTNQSTKIDIWSAGVILLTILSRRFPFFNSSDDVDAMIEIATIFGKAKMKACAAQHGCVFETTITTIGERGFTLEKIVLWATNRTATGSSKESKDDQVLPRDEAMAVRFLGRCFELDPERRISAVEALGHEFLVEGEV